ncbi:hypothetical protein C0T31_11735 [Dysgonamonadaceae bacterium]|nr:hypothetical protein C0T31_11735 [Dysgonamonadaceae bacterium]
MWLLFVAKTKRYDVGVVMGKIIVTPCALPVDYFHKEFIGKSINHRIGKLSIVHYQLILGGFAPNPTNFFVLTQKS